LWPSLFFILFFPFFYKRFRFIALQPSEKESHLTIDFYETKAGYNIDLIFFKKTNV